MEHWMEIESVIVISKVKGFMRVEAINWVGFRRNYVRVCRLLCGVSGFEI